MGIDAEILIRNVREETVTEEWLTNTSWLLCNAVGANKFFIRDGLPPDKYEAADKDWHEAFDTHPLNALWKQCVEADRFLSRGEPTPHYDGPTRAELHKLITDEIGGAATTTPRITARVVANQSKPATVG